MHFLFAPCLVLTAAFVIMYAIHQWSSYVDRAPDLDNELGLRTVTHQNLSTSIWCRYNCNANDRTHDPIGCRTCHVQNLCYRPDLNEYLFFHGDETVVSGVADQISSTSLVSMSSVDGLNVHHLTLTELPSEAASKLDIHMLDGHIFLLMKRFKPDNVMHVLHDDLLPVFTTLMSEVCSLNNGRLDECIAGVRLVLLDGHAAHDYFSLYKVFSGVAKPLLDEDFVPDGRTYCFTSAIVGLSKETIWYDYGFGSPQGATGRVVPAVILRRFVSYILQRLDVNNRTCKSHDAYAVLVLRRTNRQILNSIDLMEAIASTTGLRVAVLDPDTEISASIKLVSCSDLLVGMHGATLVLSLFLKPGSAILELFPYNVPAEGYTPYRTLVRIPGLKLKYASWENRVRDNTRTHSDWPPELGGLSHLEANERRRIESSDTPVPPHKCCSNPEWLFHIYQDTTVDVRSFVEVLKQLMTDKVRVQQSSVIHPGRVRNLKCHRDSLVKDTTEYRLHWDQPWNLQFASSSQAQCHVAVIWIQRVGDDHVESIVTETSDHVFRVASIIGERYNCWVACSVANVTGIMQWVECK